MQVFTKFISTTATSAFKTLLLALLLCLMGNKSFATDWTTSAAGPITTLSNWGDGASGIPTSFTTPGDTWTVTMAMTLNTSTPWIVGTASAAPAIVKFAPGGTLSQSSAGATFTVTIYGDVIFTGGSFSPGGAGCTSNFNVYGNCDISAGSIAKGGSSTMLNFNLYGNCNISGGSLNMGGASGTASINVNGNYTMTGGSSISGGASANLVLNVSGNFSMSGPSAMTSVGASTTNTVHLKLATGTMLIDNTSTGTWSGTNIYIDTACTAQLAGNFSNTTGSATYGLTVNGTLICPAAYVVNGTGLFTVNGVATLAVAASLGINGNISSTGSLTFNNSANYTYNGTTAQMTGTYLPMSLVSPSVLRINNTAGVTLTSSVATTGTLAFDNGILTTGVNTLSTPGTPTAVTGAGLTSYVNGTLIKTITGFTSVNYEVGDLSYAPMSLAFSSAGTAGSLGIKTTNGLHPNVATSGLTSSNMVNHYWTITNYGAAGPATVDPTATYPGIDVIGGSNTAFLTQEYIGAAWLSAGLATTNTASPYTSSPNTGIALATLAGQYIFGNLFCGTLPITGGTSAFCAGTTITLTDATPGGAWASGTPAVATISSTGVVTGVSGGTALISYTVSGCTVTSVLTVTPLPSPGVITGPTTVCVGDTITLADTAIGGTWTSIFPAKATVSSTGKVIGIAAGIDTIVYTVTNSCGTAKAKLVLQVISAASCAGGFANTLITTPELKVYPNPNTGSFTLQLLSPESEDMHVIITDIVGRQVKQLETTTNSKTAITLNHPPGIYLVTVTTANDKHVVKVTVE